ncbi:MAG TPA: hypothetical protein ENJ30_12630 [Desulfobulbaceae bacterium]|nr:hypothetical protein [Desulfobulbaceae bacterium]
MSKPTERTPWWLFLALPAIILAAAWLEDDPAQEWALRECMSQVPAEALVVSSYVSEKSDGKIHVTIDFSYGGAQQRTECFL